MFTSSLALLGLVLIALTGRLYVWPDLPPVPAHADAIIELAGPGNRDAATLALARRKVAPVVIQSTLPGDEHCLPEVPGVQIGCFSPAPATTRGEARYIGAMGTSMEWSSVILVTTPDHAWRARLRVSRCYPGKVFVATSPLPTSAWLKQIPYQWAATLKAELFERGC